MVDPGIQGFDHHGHPALGSSVRHPLEAPLQGIELRRAGNAGNLVASGHDDGLAIKVLRMLDGRAHRLEVGIVVGGIDQGAHGDVRADGEGSHLEVQP